MAAALINVPAKAKRGDIIFHDANLWHSAARATEKTEREIYSDLKSQMFIHVNYLYASMGEARVDEMKLNLVSLMAARLILYDAGKIDLDDRDSWSHKRMEVGARALELALELRARALALVDALDAGTEHLGDVGRVAEHERDADHEPSELMTSSTCAAVASVSSFTINPSARKRMRFAK